MADWASSASPINPSPSIGSRFEVATVAAARCRSTMLVDVGGVELVEGLPSEVIDDEEVDSQEAARGEDLRVARADAEFLELVLADEVTRRET